MSLLNETWYENADGTGGYYFADKDIHGKNPITITYRQARQKDFFEDAVLNPNSPYYKGDLARFAYEHNIGLHFTSEKSFALWISDESQETSSFMLIISWAKKAQHFNFVYPIIPQYMLSGKKCMLGTKM